MSDIFQEVDEEVQREKVETLWSRYQTPVFVIAGLIVAATGAWSYYTSERTKAADAANARFMAAVTLADSGKSEEAAAAFNTIAKDAPKGYAALARLRGAEELGKSDKTKAMDELDALAEDKSVDRLTQEVARLRSAVYSIDAGDREKAMLKLAPLITTAGVFRFSAQEWTGLDALFDNDYDEAERVFNVLLNDRDAPQGMRARAQAYQGLLHAARGVKRPEGGGITSVTPIIEPADGSDPSSAPPLTQEKQ
jgi:hypothetical protein